MQLALRTAPASLAALMLQSVCDHLRRTADLGASPQVAPADLDYIQSCTEAAVARIDGPDGMLGRCLLTQEWSLFIDNVFPAVIELPIPPLQDVTAIKYMDDDGTWQTLDASAYTVSAASSWQPKISPAYEITWPSTRWQADAIEVQVTTGYGAADTDVPFPILQAIRILAANYYVEREPITFASNFGELPLSARDLLAPYKVFR